MTAPDIPLSAPDIPLSAPDITDAEIDAVVSVLRTPRLSLGPQIEQFEAAMAVTNPDLRHPPSPQTPGSTTPLSLIHI